MAHSRKNDPRNVSGPHHAVAMARFSTLVYTTSKWHPSASMREAASRACFSPSGESATSTQPLQAHTEGREALIRAHAQAQRHTRKLIGGVEGGVAVPEQEESDHHWGVTPLFPQRCH